MFKSFIQLLTMFKMSMISYDTDPNDGPAGWDTSEVKAVVKAVEKALPSIVGEAVEVKFAQLSEKAFTDVADMKLELKKFSLVQKENPSIKKAFTETAMVSIIKSVWNGNVQTEAGFKRVVEAEMKVMNEWTATEGAEMVFDQFEKDILKVINEYPVVASVKILTLAKWDKVSLPKATNGITTAYVAEQWVPTASDAVTGFVTFNIYKAVSLVDMTDELMNDNMTVPDLYNLIVEFIGESQAEFLENEIINGTGSSAIEWILVNSDVNEVIMSVAGERATDIDDDYITSVITKCLMKFKRKWSQIKWIMSQYTYGLLRKIKTTDGYPLYPELRNFANPYLEGYAVIISDKMTIQNSAADIATATSLIFGDLKYYTLVRRKNLMLERGYYGNNWRDWIQSLKWTSRFGWGCTFGEALTKLSNAAT